MQTVIDPLARLCLVVAALRDPATGCEWDRAQSFETIAPYTIEEAYEVADAIAREDPDAIKEELGDLLFQVVLHAKIAEQAGLFALSDVATAIADKMERRHPHIFGDAAAKPDWEDLKAAERDDVSKRASRPASALDGVALSLPALMRAEKIQKRASRINFDWPNADGPRAKVLEELNEVAAAVCDDEREDEIGDLLFSVVNLARHLRVDPEAALRRANAKFERRFRKIEGADDFVTLSIDAKEKLWAAAKAGQREL